jgi:hypothetical protein
LPRSGVAALRVVPCGCSAWDNPARQKIGKPANLCKNPPLNEGYSMKKEKANTLDRAKSVIGPVGIPA